MVNQGLPARESDEYLKQPGATRPTGPLFFSLLRKVARPLLTFRQKFHRYREFFLSPKSEARGRPKYVGESDLLIPAPGVPVERRPQTDLVVATLLDEFSAAVFHPEFHAIPVTPFNVRWAVSQRPDFFFVESAWRGHRGIWRGQMADTEGPRPSLVKVTRIFREAGIPIIFWNKEDPPNFEYFRGMALQADYVFTTAEELLPVYRNVLGHSRVDVLPFSIQPLIHNHASIGERRGNVIFAGTYYRFKHLNRVRQMDDVLTGASQFGLDIFTRRTSIAQHQWPAQFAPYLRGTLSYSQLLLAQKLYKIALNVNSVETSKTMLSRRVLELAASGTPVVSSPSPAITHFFGDSVAQVHSRGEASAVVKELLTDEGLRSSMADEARERVTEHTANKRLLTIIKALGI